MKLEDDSCIKFSISDGILEVIIDRAEKRNALSLRMLKDIQTVFQNHRNKQELICAVITGAGEHSFSAGGDLKELNSMRTKAQAKDVVQTGTAALDAIRYFPVPVIAAVNGLTVGGGAELAVACDFRIATKNTTIGFIHGKLNVTPVWGGGTDLIALIGPAKALYLL